MCRGIILILYAFLQVLCFFTPPQKNVLRVRSLIYCSIVKLLVSKISERFGKKVKKLRRLLGLTQQELAEKIGMSKDYVGLIERGLRSPSLEVVEKIAVALNASIASLFVE